MGPLWDNITRILGLITLFVPLHQALLEAYKLTGAKQRRYWEALVYIVYGPRGRPTWADTVRVVPITLDSLGSREQWMRGPQNDLIQSFLLRAVGDSPVPDVSDLDIGNVVEIARLSAPRAVRQMSRTLAQLRITQTSPDVADGLIGSVAIENPTRETIEGFDGPQEWVERLRTVVSEWREKLREVRPGPPNASGPPIVNPAMFTLWEESFNEQFLKGAVRARRELANALKAAEFRYHEVLFRWSVLLAVGEGVAIAWVAKQLFDVSACWQLTLIGALASAGMILGSRGSKSLLDAIIGIGSRLKG